MENVEQKSEIWSPHLFTTKIDEIENKRESKYLFVWWAIWDRKWNDERKRKFTSIFRKLVKERKIEKREFRIILRK